MRSVTWKACRVAKIIASAVIIVIVTIQLRNGTPHTYSSLEIFKSQAGHRDEDLWTDPLNEKSRIGKVTLMYEPNNSAFDRALQTHKVHNQFHGHPMLVQRRPMLEGFWAKPAAIQFALLRELGKPESQRLLWLFWFDVDSVVVNYKVPLEAFLPPDKDNGFHDVKVVVSEDWNGLNNGVFALFSSVIAFRNFRPNTSLPHEDQTAMKLLLQQPELARHSVTVPQRWFNAYTTGLNMPKESEIHPGDFLVHFAGVKYMANGIRNQRMMEWCKISERHDPQWSISPSENGLSLDIRQFWQRVKAQMQN
ncbi:Alpha-1,2-galactosyltransferase [Tolypocladium paradoxum]|uniref:Alpha-1,2-galactosyltransferase n=1 Tax=Tolypocladium paradoxum TaxID=94208 RepID=A0A2S4L5L3_9HYPO|nr:Alpha-1,2-galactosyltransferase [Tolypocladium paradoxum]